MHHYCKVRHQDFPYQHSLVLHLLLYQIAMHYHLILIPVLIITLNGQASFPQILWLYREQGYQNIPSFTQLAITNKQRYLAQVGWSIKLLSAFNLHQYIDMKDLDWKMSLAKSSSSKLKEDIIKIMVLYKHGGMWIDFYFVFLRDLNWINQMNSHQYIRNKLSNYPQILIGANTFKSFNQVQEGLEHSMDIYPNYQSWLIAAIPKSQYLSDVLLALQELLALSQSELYNTLLGEGVLQQQGELTMDILLKMVLLRKQRQFESTFSAVMHYNIWHLYSKQTIYQYKVYNSYQSQQMWADIITYQIQDIQGQKQDYYFWKFTKQNHLQFSQNLDQYATSICLGADLFIHQQSQFYQTFISEANNSITQVIKQMQNQHEGEYCKSINSNNDLITHFSAHFCIIMLILSAMVCTLLFNNCPIRGKDQAQKYYL